MKKANKKQLPFEEITRALLDDQNPFPPSYLRTFSDIPPVDLEKLKSVWTKISAKRKENLLDDLIQLAEADTEVLFDDVGRIALKDNIPAVRTAGIRLLWEINDIKLVPEYLNCLRNDKDIQVRAAAVTSLALFVYLGELEEIDQNIALEIEDALLAALDQEDEHPTVKRRALEGMGYSSRSEIIPLILEAFQSGEKEWISSALFAMGRSADADRWHDAVLSMLDHPIIDVQFEAVQASGMLELEDARQPLLDMLEEYDSLDENVRMAVVNALSKIGGEDVEQTLEALLDRVEDEDEIEVIEDALEYFSFFHQGILPMGFNFSESEDDYDMYIESVDEEDDNLDDLDDNAN